MGARITASRSRAASFARFCAALSIPVLVLTAVGQRFSLIPEESLLSLVSTGIVLALIGFACGLFALGNIWTSGDVGAGSSIMALVYSMPGVALFAMAMYALTIYPQLNDISTDLVDPPQFVRLDNGAQGIAMPTQGERQQQIAAYPDITARFFPVSIERAFEAVQILVDQKGWPIAMQTIPTAASQQAVIQVVAKTRLFQFSDHVVIRIVGETGGARIDIRSASAVGRHDLGQNARRIRQMLDDLDSALQGERNNLQSASQ